MDRYKLWDFLDNRFKSVILQWVRDDRLTKRDRAILNQKISRLAQMDFSLAINAKLLAGPIYKHVYKMRMKGDVQLRPMLCRGPVDNDAEYTFLLGTVETGGHLPAGSKETAENNRTVVLDDHDKRIRHQRIPA
jgi:hypothetical protein